MADDEQDLGFRIRDRRRFDATGNPRDEQEESDERDEAAQTSTAPTRETRADVSERELSPDAQEPQRREQERAMHRQGGAERRGELTFSSFIVGLASQAFMFLGLAPDPNSGVVHRDLGQAKAMIDVLSMLEAKTHGNRTEDEDRMMEELLYELRMQYVREVRGDDPTEGKHE